MAATQRRTAARASNHDTWHEHCAVEDLPAARGMRTAEAERVLFMGSRSATTIDAMGVGDVEGLVPSQWRDRQRAAASSELRLMAAVVIDAIREYRQADCAKGGRKRHLARLAARWILSTDRSWPYSFENICAVFDVEADQLRRALARERDLGALAASAPRRRRNLVLTGPGPRVNHRRRHAAAAAPAADACLRPASQVARELHASADAR